jgi:hypothetical protein
MPPGTNSLWIGMNGSDLAPGPAKTSFDGALDDVMILGKALSEADIQSQYSAVKPRFTKAQVSRRLVELKELLDRGLILQDFYDRKVKECEVAE